MPIRDAPHGRMHDVSASEDVSAIGRSLIDTGIPIIDCEPAEHDELFGEPGVTVRARRSPMRARSCNEPAQPVIRRLDSLRRLSKAGVAAIEAACARVLKAPMNEDMISEGEGSAIVRVFLSGWACRYKALEDGRRQILSFILPGDTCDAYAYLLPTVDHSIGTLTPVTYCELDRTAFERLMSADISVAEAFHCETLVARAIQREWGINLGRRDALERVAHIICELFERLKVVGNVDGNMFAFPITQMDLADATGLSTVHLNRTLQELRAAGLITLRDRNMTILDPQALRNAAMFNPNYLHQDRK